MAGARGRPRKTYKSRSRKLRNETGEDISFTDDEAILKQLQDEATRRKPKGKRVLPSHDTLALSRFPPVGHRDIGPKDDKASTIKTNIRKAPKPTNKQSETTKKNRANTETPLKEKNIQIGGLEVKAQDQKCNPQRMVNTPKKRPWYEDIDEELLKNTKYARDISLFTPVNTPMRKTGLERPDLAKTPKGIITPRDSSELRKAKRTKVRSANRPSLEDDESSDMVEHQSLGSDPVAKINTINHPMKKAPIEGGKAECAPNYAVALGAHTGTLVAQKKLPGRKARVFISIVESDDEDPKLPDGERAATGSFELAWDGVEDINWDAIFGQRNRSSKLTKAGFTHEDLNSIKLVSESFARNYQRCNVEKKRTDNSSGELNKSTGEVPPLPESTCPQASRGLLPQRVKGSSHSKEGQDITLDGEGAKKRRYYNPCETIQEPKRKRQKTSESTRLSILRDPPVAATAVTKNKSSEKTQTLPRDIKPLKPILKKPTLLAPLPSQLQEYKVNEGITRVTQSQIDPRSRTTASKAVELATRYPGEQFTFDLNKSQSKAQIASNLAHLQFGYRDTRSDVAATVSHGPAINHRNIRERTNVFKRSGKLKDSPHEKEEDDEISPEYGNSYFSDAKTRLIQARPIPKAHKFIRIGSTNCFELVDDADENEKPRSDGSQDESDAESVILRHPVSGNPMTEDTIARMTKRDIPQTPKTPSRKLTASLRELTSTGKKIPCHGLFRTPKTDRQVAPQDPKMAGQTTESASLAGSCRRDLFATTKLEARAGHQKTIPERDVEEAYQLENKREAQRRSF